MTKDEFISRIEIWRQRQARNLIVFFVSAALGLGAWYFLATRYDALAPGLPRIVWSLAPFALFIVILVGHKLVIRYTFKRYGVLCPACGKPLGDIVPIVIATGNCGNCGEHIMDDA